MSDTDDTDDTIEIKEYDVSDAECTDTSSENENIEFSIELKNLYKKYNVNYNKCTHVKLKCKIKSPCCGKYIDCIYCHMFSPSHKFNIKDIKYVMCENCECEQILPELNKCFICDAELFDNYCDICGYFMYDHNGYKHCDKCTCCIIPLYIESHKCTTNILNDICSICLEPLKNNGLIMQTKCNHVFHNKCYKILINNTDKCPLCKTSLLDLTG
jgi:hypothetical protein